jgi:curved DNA-binding protein CbpA
MEHPGPRRTHDDPYRLLGVDANASRRDIIRAYRRAVHDAHPDIQPGDPRAAARFRALTDAYDLLSDPGRRADYDRQHPAERRDMISWWPGSPPLVAQPGGQPVRAGPVRIEPAGGQAPRHEQGNSPAAAFEDPPVVLGGRPGRRRSWPR